MPKTLTFPWKVFIPSLLPRSGPPSFGGMRSSGVSAKVPLCVPYPASPLAGVQALQTRTLGQIAERGSWLGKCCQLVSYPHLFSKSLSSICTHTNTPSVDGDEIISPHGGRWKCAEPRHCRNALRSGSGSSEHRPCSPVAKQCTARTLRRWQCNACKSCWDVLSSPWPPG